MSKQGKRKITVDLPKTKDLTVRPSVFERLGTKKTATKKTTEYCRQWAQHGSCAYGKGCKFASTHTLISPSKQRAANKDGDQKRLLKDDPKNRLLSTVVVRSGRSPEGEIDNWDQNDLEYADADVLEKRRQQLQRELDLQLKMDSGKDMRKDKKKPVSSSSSSRSSSSSSISSSSSDGSSSSTSSDRDARRKIKKGKLKRNSSSSSDGDFPSKKKCVKSDSLKRDKGDMKKTIVKKDDRLIKKQIDKKKVTKPPLGKKSLSPGKKAGGTPPITTKNNSKVYSGNKHGKPSPRRDKNRSLSPSAKERDKDRNKDRDKDKDKERDRNIGRSRSPRKGRSRSPRGHAHPKDLRQKGSSERSRPISPKKPVRRDGSPDRHRKRSGSRDRDRNRDHKDRSLERRKDKHDDKDRHDRKDRVRERGKDVKRDDKRNKGRERGRGVADKGLEKPNKPVERLLPRPEERLAALAAISNRPLEADKSSTNSKDRQDSHSERGGRNQDRNDRDRSGKRGDRMGSLDREQGEYDINLDRQYEHGHSMEHYERVEDRYDDGPRDNDRSPGYAMQGRDRRYDSGYDMPGPPRGYADDEERIYNDHMADHRGGVEMGYDDRHPHRDRSWDRRSGSMDRERYMPHKEWDNDDYRPGGDWGRERHWPVHEVQMGEWGDKEQEAEGWHHRGHPGPHRPRIHDDYGRGMRMDNRGDNNKRRPQRQEPEPAKEPPTAAPSVAVPPPKTGPEPEVDDNPIADDLSEISDDPDDILNREDMIDQSMEEDSKPAVSDEIVTKNETSENSLTQDANGSGADKDIPEPKDEEDVSNMDFEEISDGELEEERTKAGLGDALGVDWASLVADVRRREHEAAGGGARERWRPARVLARLGLAPAPPASPAPPIPAIQVAIEKRKLMRAALFGSGCEIRRALCARRDLALRRHLCLLPPDAGGAGAGAVGAGAGAGGAGGAAARSPPSTLFHAARALLMRHAPSA